ncbi:ATP-binding protein [Streptacidiphilus fuscans]|uniref:ATP-binding protein n=1 Tax=Streptacidiphilus fuscans TaxID=2789292 RepID=A0A931FBV4_9ACTN|nr:ATP-binding protein [Streptacidiphilus fuscans]MBF9067833.1 ATP-binding protein [Streptacidiphilus fuscans]
MTAGALCGGDGAGAPADSGDGTCGGDGRSGAVTGSGGEGCDSCGDGCDEGCDDGPGHRAHGAELGAARSTWPMDRQAATTFAAVASSVARARFFVRITAAMWRLAPATLADTELCMSELVGNAVRHTHSERVHCRLWSARGMLFVEVDDEDLHDVPRVACAGEDDEAGRGMLLIDTFSTAWGTVPRPGAGGETVGKTVWAALPLPPPR